MRLGIGGLRPIIVTRIELPTAFTPFYEPTEHPKKKPELEDDHAGRWIPFFPGRAPAEA